MSKVMIIGCGGVASVAIAKCCQNSDVFTEIMIASRTKSKCDAMKEKLQPTTKTVITTAQVDADNTEELIALINEYKPDAVLNVALPYQDLTIMDACLATGVDYIDTANYEAENTDDPEWRKIYEERCKKEGFTAYFDYSWQWAYKKKFEDAGITAILGSGFDPGVTSVYSAYALKHYFDEIHYIDILDCNGGDHGYPFATNFNPEINLREVSAMGSYWEDGHWVEVEPMSIKREYDFPEVGEKDMYLLHHEEIESLAKNIPGVKRIRFFMTFGQSYLTHMKCLENVGMLSTTPINFEGKEIVPIQFLKALLPDPASLGPRTVGKTNIGCIFKGVKDGKEKTIYIYNVCDLLFASNFHLIKVRSDQLELMIFYFRGLFGTYQLEAVYSGSIELYLHITTTDNLTFISGGKCNRNRDFCYFDLNVAKFKTLLYGLFMVEN